MWLGPDWLGRLGHVQARQGGCGSDALAWSGLVRQGTVWLGGGLAVEARRGCFRRGEHSHAMVCAGEAVKVRQGHAMAGSGWAVVDWLGLIRRGGRRELVVSVRRALRGSRHLHSDGAAMSGAVGRG